MDFALPQAYLLGLIVLLGVVAVVVGRQVLRVRKQEGQLASLETVSYTHLRAHET